MKILTGDAFEMLQMLPDESVNCCVTSPPYYGLRDYGVKGQLGLEESPLLYVERLVNIFRQVKRVLRTDGTLWLNLGDSYASNGTKKNNNGQIGQYGIRFRGNNTSRFLTQEEFKQILISSDDFEVNGLIENITKKVTI